jgi:5-methylcytosine-specific restriction protein A
MHLFEVHVEGQYRYQGRVILASPPLQEDQLDIENMLRRVWIFPLRLVDSNQPEPIPIVEIDLLKKVRSRRSKKLTLEELKQRARKAKKKPSSILTITTTYYRNPDIIDYARRRANGICELCENLAPFNDKDGEPFLEVHHIEWLSKGGEDSIENTVALCPNCHRKMHIINNPADRSRLKNVALP